MCHRPPGLNEFKKGFQEHGDWQPVPAPQMHTRVSNDLHGAGPGPFGRFITHAEIPSKTCPSTV